MSEFTLVKLHHAAFATADIDKTIEYWRDLLGFKLAIAYQVRHNPSLGKQYFFSLHNQIMLSFFEWQAVTPLPYKTPGEPVQGSFGFDHIALQVSSLDDLFNLQNQLITAQLPVSDVINHGIVHSIYSYDPNHIAVEFCAIAHELPPEQALILDDDTPSARVQEGAYPVSGRWPPVEQDEDDERIIVAGEGSDLFN